MEYLPVDVNGKILSRLGDASDFLIASATCSKQGDAGKTISHLLTSKDGAVGDLVSASSRLEMSHVKISSAMDFNCLQYWLPKI